MQSVKTADTGPEIAVRSILHRLGFRFRLHRKDLPGRPDIVLPRHRAIIFVHGCFWHGHDCRYGKAPKSRAEYWGPKIAANRARDARNERALTEAGWRVLDVWQCELKKPEELINRLCSFLGQGSIPIDNRFVSA